MIIDLERILFVLSTIVGVTFWLIGLYISKIIQWNWKTNKSNKNTGRRTSLRMKHRPTGNAVMTVKPDPPFGILKGGKKKTYRQYYDRPIKHKHIESQHTDRPQSPSFNPPQSPIKTNETGDSLLDTFIPETRSDKLDHYKRSLPKHKRTYTIKRKFKLGYDKSNNQVSFLKKNKTMKVNYMRTIGDINSTPLGEKKIFLRRIPLVFGSYGH